METIKVGGKEYVSAEWYPYTTDPAVLVAAAATPNPLGVVRIDADSDFQIDSLSFFADIAAAAQTDGTRVIPLVTVFLSLSGGQQWMSGPVPIGALMGDGRLPYILPRPIIVAARSSISVQLARYAAATDYSIRPVFNGQRLYNL